VTAVPLKRDQEAIRDPHPAEPSFVAAAQVAKFREPFRARKALGRGRWAFACFLPVASLKALTSISRTVRRWALHHEAGDRDHRGRTAAASNPGLSAIVNAA
jgi:hypothetical protein